MCFDVVTVTVNIFSYVNLDLEYLLFHYEHSKSQTKISRTEDGPMLLFTGVGMGRKLEGP